MQLKKLLKISERILLEQERSRHQKVLQMALVVMVVHGNRHSPTKFIPTSPEYSFLASSLVKEVAKHGGDVSGLVPGFVNDELKSKFA